MTTQWLFMAVHLIMVHGPDNQYFEINADQISSIRTPRSVDVGHFPKGTQCLITMTNGKLNAVVESCAMVDQLIKGTLR
jgi:hypothetical protein